jgi:lysophospholipid acyltransferase (LPLAT)-like uncharacterized protein
MHCFYKNWFEDHWPVWAAKFVKSHARVVRTKVVGAHQTESVPVLSVAHWHGDEIALLPHFGHLRLTILVSHSRDGQRMALAALALGYRVTRGSSTRGAVGGLLALIRAVRAGNSVVLAVDGPQGPRGECKPGIVRLAQKTGVPLFPVGVAVSRKFVFKNTWNKVYIPLPFARQVIFVGRPLYFSSAGGNQDVDPYCRKVEKSLRQARNHAERLLKSWS